MTKLEFSPTLFYQYAKSPHWIWFEKFGDQKKRGDVPALVDKFAEEGVKHEKSYIKGLEYHEIILRKKPSPKDIDEAVEQTSIWMKQGVDRIYQGYLRTEKDGVIYKGQPDLLEKRPGKSALGDYYYVPVDIKNSSVESGDEAKLQYRLQLAMYSWILKEIQHFYPDHAIIINRDSKRVEVDMDSDLSITMWDQVKKITTIMKGKEPPLKISSAAKDSPWYEALLEKAKDADDIALLYNVNETALSDLRKHGIKTVKQAAKIEPFDLPYIRGISEINLERVQMQAEALIENKVIWREPAEIPEGKMKIYFDIEGDPFLKIDYLYGFWIVDDGDKEPYFEHFIAEKEEEEEKMWADFMKWVKTIHEQDYKIYHYSPYETSSIKRLEKIYGGSDALDEFKNHFVDLAKIAKKSVIFPLYFYSIKDIAKSEFLNYKWSHPEASGANSIFWYEKWLDEGDRKVLQDIIDYNEDDVKATHVLHEWLKKNSPQQ